MTEEELFEIIDEGIDNFKKNEGYQKRIKVDKRPHSDWLIFNWRQLTWNENDLDYLIEIYPNFDKSDMISSWTLYSAVSYDSNKKRYYLKNIQADKTNLEFIAENILSFLVSSYKYITSISKTEIPFGVELK